MDKYEKKYKEALEKAKKLHKDAITLQLEQDIKDYEYIFPELAESEDERIRKELLEHSWIAWLEKQGQVKESFISQHENKMCKENDDSLTSEDERIRKALTRD